MAPRAAAAASNGMVYSATYSNVPVYELNANSNHVMRRRSDNYINATHILKAAELDKPARTRVLEKEVQLGVHEKVQGGYGKYQGTWIPLASGVELARKYHVYNLLEPIFEFTPGDQSPPPAPKHTTAASNKNKAPRAAARRAPRASSVMEVAYDYADNASELPHEDESYDNTTIASQSMIDEEDQYQHGTRTSARKRKRGDENSEWTRHDQEHRIWADALLDYYVVSGSDPAHQMEFAPPPPPEGIAIDRPVDTEGHTALHWAAAMGDVEFVKDLLRRGASMNSGNIRGETPLIKASIFANCFDKGTYQKMLKLLQGSLTQPDKHGGTVLHHVAKSALTGSRASRARYYLQVLLDTLSEVLPKPEFFDFANSKDTEGETAFHQAARASRRCTRAFQSVGIPSDVPNNWGETVDKILGQQKEKKRERARTSRAVIPSSSPGMGTSPVFDSSPLGRGRFTDPLNIMNAKSSQSFSKSLSNLYSTKINSFLQAGEEELQDKDQLLTDTQAALSRTLSELASAQRECEHLVNSTDGPDDIATLSEKHATQTHEAEALSEQLQHRYLHRAVREQEDAANKAGALAGANGTVTQNELQARIKAARQLQHEQDERQNLTHALIDAQAQAGMGKVGENCFRVLETTLGRSPDELYGTVDDLLEELEMNGRPQDPIEIEME